MNRAALQRLTIVIATWVLVACATRRTPLLSVPYANTRDIAQPAPERWSLHDSVLALFDIPSLRGSVLPEGDQEVRMSTGGGMVNQPEHVLRFVRVNGRAMGQLFTYWMTPKAGSEAEAFLDRTAKVRRSKCELVRGRVFTACRFTPHGNPDWEAFGRALDSINIWNPTRITVVRPAPAVVSTSDSVIRVVHSVLSVSDQPEYRFEFRTGTQYSPSMFNGGGSGAPRRFELLFGTVMKAFE